jgi:hypothetical protein
MSPRRWILAGVLVIAVALLAASLGSWLGPTLWVRALRATLIDTGLVLGAALALGVPLGFIAGSGVRLVDRILGRAVEIAAMLPAVLFAAALLQTTGRFYAASLALGALKGVEVAWLLRSRLARERERQSLAAQSQGRLPFSVYYRRALPRALGPALASAALTPVWLSGLDVAAVALAAVPFSRRVSLGTAAIQGSLLACLTVAALTLGLYALAWHFTARFRATDAGDDEDEGEALPLAVRRRAPNEPTA